MSEDKPLKSAYELAMERLRARDREEGRGEAGPLTDEQKEEIARLRGEARSKLAELEILHRKNVAEARDDPKKLAEVEEHYRTDRRRVESALESKIARVRKSLP
jgi:hypothetical protein